MLDLDIVDCSYCDNFTFLPLKEKRYYRCEDLGYCKLKKETFKSNHEICIYFKLLQGMHTKKWYPGKDYDLP